MAEQIITVEDLISLDKSKVYIIEVDKTKVPAANMTRLWNLLKEMGINAVISAHKLKVTEKKKV